jgi:hypothetical protein
MSRLCRLLARPNATAPGSRAPACREFGRIAVAGLAMFLAMALRPAIADESSPPAAATVLTISGSIGTAGTRSSVAFDIAMLERLGTVTIETSTPWTAGVQTFEGVPIRRLLESVGATGDLVMARAINNYVAMIPVTDFERYDVILAFRQNGEALSADSTGPLFIVYPYDHDEALRHEQIYSRSVWQLTELDVL